MPGPIRPSEVAELRAKMIPEEVFASFNELIGKSYDGKHACVLQDDVVALILEKMKKAGREIDRQEIFDNHWLDVEDIYRKAGWRVDFDRSGIGEAYAAKFDFTRKGR